MITEQPPATDPNTDPNTAAAGELAQMLLDMPAVRWFAVRRRYDVNMEQAMDDTMMMLVIACNEQHFQESGRNDWERFEQMGIRELSEQIGLDLTAAVDASKSDGSNPSAEGSA